MTDAASENTGTAATASSGEDTVKLIGADGETFTVAREVAIGSGTIKSMLSSDTHFMEAATSEVRFPEIRGDILGKVCEYLEYKHKYQDETKSIPKFNVEVEDALELLMAADYLDL